MKLAIDSIESPSDILKERVVLIAKADLRLSRYAILACDVIRPSTLVETIRVKTGPVAGGFWFSTKEIKEGDYVVLYTKAGKESQKHSSEGATSHFFYWGQTYAIWSDVRQPVLVQIEDFDLCQREDMTEEPRRVFGVSNTER